MDLALDEHQADLVDGFERFFAAESTPERVRAAEPGGFDPGLWSTAVELGIPAMATQPARGGATALDLALVGGLAGRHLAPIPVIETLVAVRTLDQLAGAGGRGSDRAAALLAEAGDGTVVSVALDPAGRGEARDVAAGALAEWVLASVDDRLVALDRSARLTRYQHVHGSYPLGRWRLDPGQDAVVLAEAGGDQALAGARTLFAVLAGAALMGMARRAVEIGAAYAVERRAFGVPIGSFQGVAHPLADSAIEVDGGELLVRRTAWLLDQGDDAEAAFQAELVAGFCGSAATRATARAVHVHGGYGAALDHDIQLFHQRARSLQALLGDPAEHFHVAGGELLARRGEDR